MVNVNKRDKKVIASAAKQSSAVHDSSGSPRSARDDIAELTADLQRVRADFENYRKNAEIDRQRHAQVVKITTIAKLLPIIDNIERAVAGLPAELADNAWAQGVIALRDNLFNELAEMGVTKINAAPGTKFDPTYHDAVQMDENADGENEIIESELQTGYLLDGQPIRHAMVRVTRK
jgi:molecular chaperone GrpE